jgi:hypothetical protein
MMAPLAAGCAARMAAAACTDSTETPTGAAPVALMTNGGGHG